jgi:DNA-binding YbaB/EbfC family protein
MNINPLEFVKNLQQMQDQMKGVQDKLKDVKATGSAGGDLVKVTINGQMEIEDIKLDPIAVDPRDVAMLEDLILSAITGATQSIKEKIQSEVSSDTMADMLKGMM